MFKQMSLKSAFVTVFSALVIVEGFALPGLLAAPVVERNTNISLLHVVDNDFLPIPSDLAITITLKKAGEIIYARTHANTNRGYVDFEACPELQVGDEVTVEVEMYDGRTGSDTRSVFLIADGGEKLLIFSVIQLSPLF